jgi:hypothetical protein
MKPNEQNYKTPSKEGFEQNGKTRSRESPGVRRV